PIYYNNSLPVEVLPATVVNHIELNQLFDYEDENFDKFNLLIKYMNGEDITYDDIKPYERINDDDLNETNFFLIPLAIFCIESYVRNMLAKT
ncbi:MAG: hypothetical protein IKA36_04930, partial [Clostridia bacterium]|nr:hypothetical protein [Clostridia bacterium]